jgi:hypothetical protein
MLIRANGNVYAYGNAKLTLREDGIVVLEMTKQLATDVGNVLADARIGFDAYAVLAEALDLSPYFSPDDNVL